MPRTSWFPLALAAMIAPTIATGEDAPASIATDTTWTAEASPYRVDGETVVVVGATLTLEPGVRVELSAESTLLVEGALIARGIEAAPVTFTGLDRGDGPERWTSVIFASSADDATFVDVGEYESGSLVEGVVFEHAQRAVVLEGASPYVTGCTFRQNEYIGYAESQGGAAILVGPGSRARIRGNLFEDNTSIGFAQGGAIFVDFADPIIQDNVFRRNEASYGGAVTTAMMASPIVGNRFEENDTGTEGGAIALFSTISAFIDNHVEGNGSAMDGAGVHVCVTCFPHATPFLLDNVIVDNHARDHGAGGVGAAYLRLFAGNTLRDNTSEGHPSDFGWFNQAWDTYPDWVIEPIIAGNWWGTTDTDAIAETIHDGLDDDLSGVVSFEPVLQAAPGESPPRVTLTTRKITYVDPDDPMPLFLTLYNPGAAREMDLVVLVEYDDAPPVPVDLPFDLPTNAEGRLSMPERSVHFTSLDDQRFDPDHLEGVTGGALHAALFDPDSGDRIGVTSTIRFIFEGGER